MGNKPTYPTATRVPSSATPTWRTNCSSIPSGGQTQCTLPLIGPIGYITNYTPSLNQAPDKNFIPNIADCHTDQQGCSQVPNCDNSPITVNCTCNAYSKVDPNVNWCQCSAGCYSINESISCPLGTYNTNYYQSPNINAVCQYSAADPNMPWKGSGLSTGQAQINFVVPMQKRQALTAYLTAFMNALYHDPNGTSVFHSQNYLGIPCTSGQSSCINDQSGCGACQIKKSISLNIPGFEPWMLDVASYPQLVYTPPNIFGVILYIYNTVTDPQPSPNLDGGGTGKYLQSFTLESPDPNTGKGAPLLSKPYQLNTSLPIAFNTNSPLTFSTIDPGTEAQNSNKYYIFVDLANKKIYNNNISDPSQLVTINSVKNPNSNPPQDFYIVGRVYPCQITGWSPILYYLFSQTYNNLPYDSFDNANGFCNTVFNTAQRMPKACYEYNCSPPNFSNTCKTIVQTQCSSSNFYNPKFNALQIPVQEVVLNAHNHDCDCYNTRIAPGLTPQPVYAGMCFDNHCSANQQLLNAFGLTDSTCQTEYCQTVGGWLFGLTPDQKSLQREVLDESKFSRLCGGYNFQATYSLFNYKVMGVGITIAILFSILAFVLSKKIWVAVIVAIIFLALALFLAYDLHGIPHCPRVAPGQQQVCRTKVTNITIPDNWCSYQIGCDCNNEGYQCPDNKSLCMNGTCISLGPPTSPPGSPPSSPPIS